MTVYRRDNTAQSTAHIGGGDSSGDDQTSGAESVKLDSNGKPFNYPEFRVPKKEYAEFMDQVGRKYDTEYKGRAICVYKNTKKIYYFENRGIGDYNIFRVERNRRNE